MYKDIRGGYENQNKAIFGDTAGEYGIPVLYPVNNVQVENWISFNFAKGCEEPNIHGVHFFIDDYQFLRVWQKPDVYCQQLKRFAAVMTPDFSTYTDFPKAIQVYNHFRKHWLGAYWQANGVNVIPTISWADENSLEWCFDGEPVGGTVAVSSVGTQMNPDSRRLFLMGYKAMMEKLEPETVIFYGAVPDGCDAERVIVLPSYQNKFKNIVANDTKQLTAGQGG